MKKISILRQQKAKIQRNGEDIIGFANVVLSEFDDTRNVVFFGVCQNRFRALGVACRGFDFHEVASAFVACDKVDFQPRILMVVVELPAHFHENIGNQVLKNRPLVTVEIALQNIVLRALLRRQLLYPPELQAHI